MGLGVDVKMEGGSCWLDGLLLGQRQLVWPVGNVNLTTRNSHALAARVGGGIQGFLRIRHRKEARKQPLKTVSFG